MSEIKGLRVVVAGAGAIGSVCAVLLARQGAKVVLADPAPLADNASGVAAGMLAPVSEALFDAASAAHLPLLRAGLHAWDRLLPDLAASIDRAGAVIQVADLAGLADRAHGAGAVLEWVSADQARGLSPGFEPSGDLLFTDEDRRLEPRAMLGALHHALRAEGGELACGDAAAFASAGSDLLIQATGPGPGLIPIKGQILRFPGSRPLGGAVVRGEGIYVAPSSAGVIAGATMEEGRADREVDPEVVERLRGRAVQLFPALAGAQLSASAGVRAATPDGLPIVGPSGDGVMVARGARRNGWLLAPLIAEVVIERIAGPASSIAARAFDPARFPQGRLGASLT